MIETAMIGRDGVVGTPAALEGKVALNRAVVRINGFGSMMELEAMRAAVVESFVLLSRRPLLISLGAFCC